jgi:hypothetical protein
LLVLFSDVYCVFKNENPRSQASDFNYIKRNEENIDPPPCLDPSSEALPIDVTREQLKLVPQFWERRDPNIHTQTVD